MIENERIFMDTMKMCRSNSQLSNGIDYSITQQQIWTEETYIPPIRERYGHTEVLVADQRTFQAASQHRGRVCVLNFANFHAPCAFSFGSNTQEEVLCRTSTLFPCINDESAMVAFYEAHEHIDGYEYNSDLIYTPDVIVFKDDRTQELLPQSHWFYVDVITCAAPFNRYGSISDVRLYQVFLDRFDRIFEVAAYNDVDVLILGAFGCGAFGNSPRIVAEAAKEVTEKYSGIFEKVVFAVPGGRGDYNHNVFEEVFQ